jgi:hypothetical protein
MSAQRQPPNRGAPAGSHTHMWTGTMIKSLRSAYERSRHQIYVISEPNALNPKTVWLDRDNNASSFYVGAPLSGKKLRAVNSSR